MFDASPFCYVTAFNTILGIFTRHWVDYLNKSPEAIQLSCGARTPRTEASLTLFLPVSFGFSVDRLFRHSSSGLTASFGSSMQQYGTPTGFGDMNCFVQRAEARCYSQFALSGQCNVTTFCYPFLVPTGPSANCPLPIAHCPIARCLLTIDY